MSEDEQADGLTELRASARGWQGVQLAVLGFIGLCGVLNDSAGSGSPRWVRVVAGVLVLLSLALACLATAMVAAVAWPLYAPAGRPRAVQERGAARTGRGLRSGIALTYVAVGVLAVATTSGWWPGGSTPGGSQQVQVTTSSVSVCGRVEDAPQGVLALEVSGQRVLLALRDVGQIRPVASC